MLTLAWGLSFSSHPVVTTHLFLMLVFFLPTQMAAMCLNMERWKKAASHLMRCKKRSDDLCLRMGSPCTVKPILTSSRPSDLSNYSLFLRADRGDYHYMEKSRWVFSGALCLYPMKHLLLLAPIQPYPHFLYCLSQVSNLKSSIRFWEACVCDMPVCV